ncbi:RES family NAD+ phosphorylase [Streptomyces yangpuensis]|uniref:RES family NAD+ phosphorylase n=1 Tax=Streptomyces yangpuensis TaxID=1648182 RepID=UPI0037FB6FB2
MATGRQLYRVHESRWTCWHFACLSESRKIGSRFDTTGPVRGTCYTATDPLTALAEFLGYAILCGPYIATTALDGLSVSRVTTTRSYRVADLTRRFCPILGALGRELSVLTPYATTQAWARRWEQAGFEGVLYYPRHDAKPTARSIALFGPVEDPGEDEWPDPPNTPAGEYLRSFARAYGLIPLEPRQDDIERFRIQTPPAASS